MAERNVDLVIRARNNASGALEKLNQALDELASAQRLAARDAQGLSTALERADAAVAAQTSVVDGAKRAYEEIGAAVDRSQAAFRRQAGVLEDGEQRLRDLRQQAERAAATLERMRNFQGPLTPDGLRRLEAAEAAYAGLTREIRKVEGTNDRARVALDRIDSELRSLTGSANAAEAAMSSLLRTQREVAAARIRENSAINAQARRGFGALGQAETNIGRNQAREIAAQAREARAAQPVVARLAMAMRDLGQATRLMGAGMRRGRPEVRGMRAALREFYGDSRQSLSLMQRLRGEVLSLTATFVGFYGVFEQGRRITQAFSQLEAATVRLNAAFDGNDAAVAGELANLRAEADRLGISFDVLSDNYSKFTISGQAAGLQSDQLRMIFTQVSEAGRVLRLSNEQIAGTFTALTQIAGKGTLQMEELRQQLGDRIPGAVGLLAQALGFTTENLDEFYKAVENGQIGAQEALVAFGQALEDTYGDQIEDALDTVQAKIGRLQNLLFERRLTAANSGFIAGLETALAALNEFLASEEGIQFFEALGAAFGRLFELLPGIIDNFDKLVFAFKALLAIKLGQAIRQLAVWFTGLAASVGTTRAAMVRFDLAMARLNAGYVTAIRGTGRLNAALRTMRVSLASVAVAARGLFAAFGGPIGLAITALSFFAVEVVAGAITATDELNDVLRENDEIMAQVGAAYQTSAGDVDKFAESLRELSSIQVEQNRNRLQDQLSASQASPLESGLLRRQRGSFNDFRPTRALRNATRGNQEAQEAVRAFIEVAEANARGEQNAEDYRAALNALREALGDVDSDVVDLLATEDRRLATQQDLIERIGVAEQVLDAQNGTVEDAAQLSRDLGLATEETTEAVGDSTAVWGRYNDALNEIRKNIPELDAELKRMEGIAQIERQFESALAAARALPDAIQRAAAEAEAFSTRQFALDSFAVGNLPAGVANAQDGVSAAAALLRDSEGFRSEPYNDPRTDRNGNQVGPNIYRAGFGSDTITLEGGTVVTVTKGMNVTREDAERDLQRRITQEFMPLAIAAAGQARFDSFTPQQQGVLTSIAYNYGEIPDRIVPAVRGGSAEEIAQAIRSLGGDNGGINAGRRNEEAAIFAQGVGADIAQQNAIDVVQQEREAAQETAEARQEALTDLEDYLDGLRREVELQNASRTEREVAEAIRDRENELAELGLTLGEAERAQIEDLIRAKNAKADAEDANNKALEEGQRLLEQVSFLQRERDNLVERREFAEDQGDTALVAQTDEAIGEVTDQLNEAIEAARAFWEEMGGPNAQGALQTLSMTEERLNRVQREVVLTGEQANKMIADGATAAFQRFAQRVANGENAMVALREEFQRFAAEFLIEIGKMILRQTILNALQRLGGAGGGGVGGLVANAVNAVVRHGGGMAGSRAGPTRRVDPAIFANAVRYHSGGLAGFRPDEVPAVLQRNEEILTEADPRHRFNGGGAAPSVKVVNAVDGSDALDHALSASMGEEVFMNFVRSNRDGIKAALE